MLQILCNKLSKLFSWSRPSSYAILTMYLLRMNLKLWEKKGHLTILNFRVFIWFDLIFPFRYCIRFGRVKKNRKKIAFVAVVCLSAELGRVDLCRKDRFLFGWHGHVSWPVKKVQNLQRFILSRESVYVYMLWRESQKSPSFPQGQALAMPDIHQQCPEEVWKEVWNGEHPPLFLLK